MARVRQAARVRIHAGPSWACRPPAECLTRQLQQKKRKKKRRRRRRRRTTDDETEHNTCAQVTTKLSVHHMLYIGSVGHGASTEMYCTRAQPRRRPHSAIVLPPSSQSVSLLTGSWFAAFGTCFCFPGAVLLLVSSPLFLLSSVFAVSWRLSGFLFFFSFLLFFDVQWCFHWI